MDIESLRVFKAVAEAQSVSGAARELHCVPSNVTARIRGLENELGQKLFLRKPRGMGLTPQGARLLDYARKAVDLLAEARDALTGGRGPAGTLLIGSTEAVAGSRLPPLLITFGRTWPDVALSLRLAASRDLARMVLDCEIEGAFIVALAADPQLEAIPVFEETLHLISAPHMALTEENCGALVVQQSGCIHREVLERWAELRGITVRRRLELPTPETAIACVAAGMGIAVMPFSTLDRLGAMARVALHDLPPDLRRSQVSFVRSRAVAPTPAMQAFMALCREASRAEWDDGLGLDYPLGRTCATDEPMLGCAPSPQAGGEVQYPGV